MTSARTCSILVLASLLGASACGGSTKKVDPAADLALAKRAVLTKADLPGYSGEPHTKSDDIPAKVKRDFAACMGVPTTIFDDTPGAQTADSLDFSKGDAQISNSIEIDPKKSDVDKGWDQISKQGAAPCLQKLFEALFTTGDAVTAGVTFSHASVTRFDTGIGDRSVGYSVSFTATGPARTAVFYIDLVFLPRDRAGLEFDFFNIGTPLDHSFETALVQKVYDRIGTDAK
jgi:hypothetical protein